MKKPNIFIIALIALCCISSKTYSQTVVYYDQATTNTGKPEKCPNCPQFGHFFSSWALTVPGNSEHAQIKTLQSSFVTTGYRHIFRVSQYFSTGFTIDVNRSLYGILQKDGKNVHDSVLHKKETFIINHTDASWFLRMQFQKRRGMHIGNFIDLGGFAGYNF
jgi:hypothetical protein